MQSRGESQVYHAPSCAEPGYSAENDRLVQDLQDRLEEAQAEIAQRRKDDKDMKGKDRNQQIAIAGVSWPIIR